VKSISSSEANRQFSSVLRKAASGETILITLRGKAVATISPAGARVPTRQAARTALFSRLAKQKAAGKRSWSRADLYER
jgi:prevent-host-death family protein